MTVFITLSIAGADSGPFNLYSNIDGYVTAFESGVPKASLVAGYSSALVPDFTTTIKVLSTGTCTNYIYIPVEEITTTTTTSTTTVDPGTTTSTTTGACLDSYQYSINIYDCGICTPNGGGGFDNLYPLTIGKFYYYPSLNVVIEITSYLGCGGPPIGTPILDIDQADDCASIICPTTTTTTTSIT
jgi:hypothetical protein